MDPETLSRKDKALQRIGRQKFFPANFGTFIMDPLDAGIEQVRRKINSVFDGSVLVAPVSIDVHDEIQSLNAPQRQIIRDIMKEEIEESGVFTFGVSRVGVAPDDRWTIVINFV